MKSIATHCYQPFFGMHPAVSKIESSQTVVDSNVRGRSAYIKLEV